jgi:hypothetical protein
LSIRIFPQEIIAEKQTGNNPQSQKHPQKLTGNFYRPENVGAFVKDRAFEMEAVLCYKQKDGKKAG